MQKEEFNEIDDLLDDENLAASSEDNPEEKYIHYQFTADKGQSLIRIDKFLIDRIEGVSRSKIQQAAEGVF